MRVSKLFMSTQREVPADAEIASHRLMLRAGLMRKVASGVYGFLPLGYRSFRKVENIVREEMDRSGAQELIMPAILPAEVYMASGRWEKFGPEMFRLTDRGGRQFCLGPTHEEPFTETVRDNIRSYRQLPVTLYQIQHKYRDEKRPRFGIMRGREFVMKDAYSFDVDEEGLDISYQAMHKAYCRIFDRCQLDYILVDADSGAMGGSGSQEFMVKSEVGEDAVIYCDSCGYAANEEKATSFIPKSEEKAVSALEKVSTPNIKTIDELVSFFATTADQFVKTLLYLVDGQPVAVLIRGDREVNETKLANYFDALELTLADPHTVEEITGAPTGFAGPIGLKKDIKIIADLEVAQMTDFILGANEADFHYCHAKLDRDFPAPSFVDIRKVAAGDLCPLCQKPLHTCRGVEVGHIFKLGTKYSEALSCNFLDQKGQEKPMIMGCYGIGVGRTLAAVIEQHHDENGIIWPMAIAPYHVILIPTNTADQEILALSEEIYQKLQEQGIEVLLDDREERPGVKFKDADLIGIPLRITVGRKAKDGIVELKDRKSGEVWEKTATEAITACTTLIEEGM